MKLNISLEITEDHFREAAEQTLLDTELDWTTLEQINDEINLYNKTLERLSDDTEFRNGVVAALADLIARQTDIDYAITDIDFNRHLDSDHWYTEYRTILGEQLEEYSYQQRLQTNQQEQQELERARDLLKRHGYRVSKNPVKR